MSETLNREVVSAYVTRYALSTGIQLVRARICHDVSPEMIAYNVNGFTQFAHGADWHLTVEEARKRSEEMRNKKIASLKKSIANLEELSFDTIKEVKESE